MREALRSLRTGRGTFALAFAILTLTMAAATIAFSIVDGVVFRALPYAKPDRLVSIEKPGQHTGRSVSASPAQYFDWREGSQALEAVATASVAPPMTLTIGDSTKSVTVRRVSTNLFELLGVRPVAGRVFDAKDERPGSPAVAILSHDLWQRRFGGDHAVIGRLVTFDTGAREIAGVLPAQVWYPMTGPAPDLYIPYIPGPADRSNYRAFSMSVVGRLRDGVSVEQARADLARIAPAVVQPLHDRVIGPGKNAFLLVLAAVCLMLLVGALNIASLLLARAATRSREFATRLALGATRRRLIGSVVSEGLLLASASAAAALVISYWGVGFAVASLPPGISRASTISVDGRIAAVSMAVALLCGLVASFAPAILATRDSISECLKGNGGAVLGSRRRERALGAFLAADIAFVTILLASTVLVVTSFVLITTADLGFDRRNVMSFSFGQWNNVSAPRSARAARHADLIAKAKSVDGVVDAAVASGSPPLSGGSTTYSVELPGQPDPTPDEYWETRFVTSGYFRVVGIPLVRGRLVEESDGAGAPRISVINEAAARRFFPGRDPVGQTLILNGLSTIVGVVRAVHFEGPERDARPAVYMPIAQQRAAFGTTGVLHVRTARDPRPLAESVREAVRPALGNAPIAAAMFIDDDFQRLTAGRRFNAVLMTTFGLVAVAIGALGVYGTMTFVVARRAREIGLRMALGATPSNVLGSVLRNALGRVALGAVIGLAGAWAASSLMALFVFGIQPTDPRVYAAVAALLGIVGIAAAFVPAVRASRLDPLTVMRHE